MEKGAEDSQAPEDQPTAPVPAPLPAAPGATRHRQRSPSKRFGVEHARNPQFTLVFRGYEREAVDRYVAQVIELITELEATQTREGTVQRALEEVGEQTSSILQKAHETAAEIAATSRSQAEGRLARAEHEAQQTVAEAEAEAQRVRTDARAMWQQRSRLIEELRRLSDEVLTVADDALERLDPPDDEPTTAETEPTTSDAEIAPPGSIAAPPVAPEDASGATPQPTEGEPWVREISPTPPGDGAAKPPRRTLGPIGDPLDVPPQDAAPASEPPAVRRAAPGRRRA